MAVTELTDGTFEAELKQAALSVVDVYASWCGQCRMFAPKYRRLSERYSQVAFFKLEGEQNTPARGTI